MDFSAEELEQIFKLFKEETEEHITNINKCLLSLEKNTNDISIISELFRAAHSIKGSARMLGISAVQNIAHKIEDILGLSKDGAIVITPDIIDILCKGADTIDKIIKKISIDNLAYTDENIIKIAEEIENLKPDTSVNEKKNVEINKPKIIDLDIQNDIYQEEPNIINLNNSEKSILKELKLNLYLLDNSSQKDNSIKILLGFIDNELNKGIPIQEKEILRLVKKNLNCIKNSSILPPINIIQIIEYALKVAFHFSSNRNFEEIIDSQKKIWEFLELMMSNEKYPATTKQTNINNKTEKNKETDIKPSDYAIGIFKSLRVDTQKLDNLEKQVEELIAIKIRNTQNNKSINDTIESIENLQNKIHKSYNNIQKLAEKNAQNNDDFAIIYNLNKQLEKANNDIDNLYSKIYEFQKGFYYNTSKLNSVSDEIENTVKNIRILPMSTIFHMFPRMVRDIARKQGKQAEIIITGSETGADKSIIEGIKTPLIHIITNAMDHGIETPDERIRKGKNPTGKILLNSYLSENIITIEILDDGKGLNPIEIKEKVIKENLMSVEEVNQLTELQLLNMIFWPGFSTEENVTNTSGRGVGLDIVNTQISQLGGKISIQTQKDEGFKITIKIPITLATLNALLIKSNEQIFAMPSNLVKCATYIRPEEVVSKEGRPYIIFNDISIRLEKLTNLLNYPSNNVEKNKYNVVIIQVEDTYLAIEVDEFIKTEEIIQKRLNPPLSRVKNIAGISSLPDGQTCLILNLNDIIKSAFSKKELHKKSTILKIPKKDKSTILLVDDSLTTITLEKNILKSAGYNVLSATNGIEALEVMTQTIPDIIITDIEMPEMNGFELIEKVREKDKDTQILILTSHDEELSNPTINLANGIILKQGFTENKFLAQIEKHLKA